MFSSLSRLFAVPLLVASAFFPSLAPLPSPHRLPLFANPKVAYVQGEINALTAFQFEVQMRSTEGFEGDRLIVIDSPGGDVQAGNLMIGLIDKEELEGTKVVCVVLHDASSMAFNLLTHCTVRLALQGSLMVVHKIAMTEPPALERMTAKNLRRLADDMDRQDAPFRQDNAKAMGLTLPDYDRYADNETEWTAAELYRRGYLQAILPP